MASGGGGGGDVVVSPRAELRHHHAQARAWLPLDVVLEEIATRSDAATLVRCAATCRDARRRIAEDPDLRARLRLRDTGRFLLPLLRGHLALNRTCYDGDIYEKTGVCLVDTTAPDTTSFVKVTLVEPESLRNAAPLDSRGGLVLVRATSTTAHPSRDDLQLLVCNPATGRRLALLPALFDTRVYMDKQYVLLVGNSDGEGGAAVGRPFQVVMAKLELSKNHRSYRRLLVKTFSSEHGAWSPLREIPTPNLHGRDSRPSPLQYRPLVVGDVVHWLCLTDSGSYVLTLDVKAAHVDVMALPASFPRAGMNNHPKDERYRYLLATASAGGNPIVLVADKGKISAWEQSKHTKTWKLRPQVVIENKAILEKHVPDLVCFAERSGVVLLRIDGCRLHWLDLHSKKIVRSLEFKSYPLQVYCPYEMDSSSWVPTFSRAGTF